MAQIIAIGGAGFGTLENDYKMERYLIAQTGKTNPKVCFLGQASAESPAYARLFHRTFKALETHPSTISLFGRVTPHWKTQVLEQDLIFVGGGNTRSMLALWREWGMDQILKEAYDKGIVLCGSSAGAICWFEACVTDSVWPLGTLKGLGFLQGSCCPHYDSEPERRPTYLQKVQSGEIIPGIALEDYTAAHFVDGSLRTVVSAKAGTKAYRVSPDKETGLEVGLL
ncbi:MAG: peptidase E [Gammaproteobacteria bacterium]|nr:peptidase E [Gammaproteobacteria bacterium]MBP9729130.1 peptidase E [Gammaproteobacteria bacterium]